MVNMVPVVAGPLKAERCCEVDSKQFEHTHVKQAALQIL